MKFNMAKWTLCLLRLFKLCELKKRYETKCYRNNRECARITWKTRRLFHGSHKVHFRVTSANSQRRNLRREMLRGDFVRHVVSLPWLHWLFIRRSSSVLNLFEIGSDVVHNGYRNGLKIFFLFEKERREIMQECVIRNNLQVLAILLCSFVFRHNSVSRLWKLILLNKLKMHEKYVVVCGMRKTWNIFLNFRNNQNDL